MFKIFNRALYTSFFLLVFLSIYLFSSTNKAFASESISSFYSRIEINQDTSLTITEQIDYNTTVSKHGIYRYIPISYNKNGEKVVLPISNISVTDDRGFSIPFTRSSDGRFLNLKIGDPDVTFSGEKIYVITYTVERGVDELENSAQLLWDITGEGWQIPIRNSSATVISRFAPITGVACFSGPVGGTDGLCKYEQGENQVTFEYANQIYYGDNMTVQLDFPKESQLIFPTQSDLTRLWLQVHWPIFLFPIPPIILFIWWYKKGRDIEFISQDVFDLDPQKPTKYRTSFFQAREPMVYEPLVGLTPGESGALIDERIDIQDIVAEILELARKKYLSITTTEQKVLFITSKEYEFKKLEAGTEPITDTQQTILNALFKYGDVITLSQLKGKFYQSIPDIKIKMEQALVDKHVYTGKPTNKVGMGILFVFVSTGLLFGIYRATFGELGISWPIIPLLIQGAIGLLFAKNLSQKTAVGTNLWLQSRGLRATIKRGAWREKINEKHLFIEKMLPFAVSLGVVKQLAKDMEELHIQPPSYIAGSNMSTFMMADFISGFNKDVANSLAYNPSSSSSGGGFSGGGGGGGGGGSW